MRIPTVEAQRKFFVSIAEKENITVRWDEACKVPNARLEGKRGIVELPVPGLHTVKTWTGFAHHEISHLFKEQHFVFETGRLLKRTVERDVWNVIADYMCEFNKFGVYPGRDRIIADMRREVFESNPDLIMGRSHLGISALFQYDLDHRRAWQGMMPDLKRPEGMEPYMGRFEELGLIDRVHHVMETQDAAEFYELVQLVCEAIMRPVEDPELPKSKKKSKAKGSSGKGGGGGGSETSGGGGRSTTPEVPESTGEKEEESEKETEKETEEEAPDTGGGEEEEVPETKEEVATPHDYEESDIPDEITKIGEAPTPSEDPHGYYYNPFKYHEHIFPNYRVDKDRAREIQEHLAGSTVSKRIKRYLKIVSKDGYYYGQKSGKLHPKNVYRVYSGTEEPRIFKQKNKTVLKTNSAITILLDCSGSMRYSGRYTIGAACCIAISQTLTDLRIPHEVLGFSEQHKLWTYHFKPFDKHMNKDKLVRGFASRNILLKENADGESVLYAAERLQERKERHKLLIVLSDGSPAGTYDGDGHWYLKQVTKAIEESGMDLLGIGIQTSAVKRYYSHTSVVKKVTDLDAVLFEHLKRQLL